MFQRWCVAAGLVGWRTVELRLAHPQLPSLRGNAQHWLFYVSRHVQNLGGWGWGVVPTYPERPSLTLCTVTGADAPRDASGSSRHPLAWGMQRGTGQGCGDRGAELGEGGGGSGSSGKRHGRAEPPPRAERRGPRWATHASSALQPPFLQH